MGSEPKGGHCWVVCLYRRSGSVSGCSHFIQDGILLYTYAGSDYCSEQINCLILVSHCYKFISTVKDRIHLPWGIPLESPEVHFGLIVFAWHFPALCKCVLHLLNVWSGHCKLLSHQLHLTVNIQKRFLLTTSALGTVWTTCVQSFDKNEMKCWR